MRKLLILLSFIILPLSFGGETPRTKIVLTKFNTISLNGEVNEESAANLIHSAYKLLQSRNLNVEYPIQSVINLSDDSIYLILNTPGGGIISGLDIIDFLKPLGKIHTISLFSASMGFQIVQALDRRYVIKHGTLMAHKARGGFSGEFPGQLDSRYNYWLKKINALDEITVKRTNGKHTKESFATLMENEYWCDAADCIEQGLADEIVDVVCDASLLDTTERTENLNFFGAKIEVKLVFSNCPIITGPVSQKVSINSQPYNWDNDAMNDFIRKEILKKTDPKFMKVNHE